MVSMTLFMGKLSSHFTSLTYVTMLGRIAFLLLLHFFFPLCSVKSSQQLWYFHAHVGRFLFPSDSIRGGDEPLGQIVILGMAPVGLGAPPYS